MESNKYIITIIYKIAILAIIFSLFSSANSDNINSVYAKQNLRQLNEETFDESIESINDYTNEFYVENKVRLENFGTDPTWKDEVDAQIGDKVEFQIQYKNLSDVRQPSVMIRNVLPKSLRYVEGSTYLFNTVHPNGAHINEDTVIANGVNIGNYLPGANAYLRITAEVVGDTMADGENILVDWGQGQAGPEVGKQIVLQDYAKVNVYKKPIIQIVGKMAVNVLLVILTIFFLVRMVTNCYKLHQLKSRNSKKTF